MGDTIIVDVETKKSLAEVGGENHIRELGISVAGVYSYAKDAFFAWEEKELPELEKLLGETSHIIGFNLKHFDLPVLEPYLAKVVFAKFAITDMFEDAVNFLGHRVGLGGLAKATLGVSKSGHGLEALEWFKQGRVDDIKKYCLDDVKITRDLYEYGKKNSHVLFESFVDGKTHSIPVNWGRALQKPVLQTIEEAFNNRKQLAIEYVSSENNDGLGFKKTRLVDVYKIKNGEIEAFCHLRQALINFRISRILKAELTGNSYVISQDFQKSLF